MQTQHAWFESPPSPTGTRGTVVDRYRVPANEDLEASAEVTVLENDSLGRYEVKLPALDDEQRTTLLALRENLRSSIPVEETGTPEDVLSRYLDSAKRQLSSPIAPGDGEKFRYYLKRELYGFWELDPILADDDVEEVSVTRFDRPVRVLHRRHSRYMFMETNVGFGTEERLQAFIRRLAHLGGTTVSLAQPSLEVTLRGVADRRVTATLGDEISRPGSTLAIRKQREQPITIVGLASPEPAEPRRSFETSADSFQAIYEEDHLHKTLSALMAAYFWLLLERTTNVLIAGTTNSGKTTLMNAVLALMNPRAKIVTAEDVLEVSLPDHLHWQRMKTRPYRAGLSPSAGRYEYGLPELLKLALRFSPTILTLGEMRGEESETVAAAITLGFSTITTIHAENAERCVQRLTTPPMRFSEGHVRDITAIATMGKIALPDGRVVRRVVSVDEVLPLGADRHEIRRVFGYDQATDSFSPTTPAEVLDKSHRLNQIADAFGRTPAQVQRDLTLRAAHISQAIRNKDFTVNALAGLVKTYAS